MIAIAFLELYTDSARYMSGGISSNETALGDLYILTLPSFTWISVREEKMLACILKRVQLTSQVVP
jgi:hypothetical protein